MSHLSLWCHCHTCYCHHIWCHTCHCDVTVTVSLSPCMTCSPTSDGSAAVILASEDFVRRHNLQSQAVLILGMEMGTDTPSTFNKSAITLVGLVTLTPPPPSTRALSLVGLVTPTPLHPQQELNHCGRPCSADTPSTFNKSTITVVGLVTPTPPPPSTRALSLW